jgi:hypothetical protein
MLNWEQFDEEHYKYILDYDLKCGESYIVTLLKPLGVKLLKSKKDIIEIYNSKNFSEISIHRK